jgi:hypothetical protein
VVVLQLGGWEWGLQPLTIKNKPATNLLNEPRTWMNSLVKDISYRMMIPDLAVEHKKFVQDSLPNDNFKRTLKNIS